LWLVVPARVEGELAQQLAVVGDDPDVQVGDQQGDSSAGTGAADPDVMEPAVVP
jgi:hypothetical protein